MAVHMVGKRGLFINVSIPNMNKFIYCPLKNREGWMQ